MKKCLIAIAMVLTLSMNADAAAQKHRHTPRTEQVDSSKSKKDAIEAFSDTTANAEDAEDDKYISYRRGTSYSRGDAEDVRQVLEGVGNVVDSGMIIGIVAIVIIFLVAPLLIIITIFYFINRSRRDRYKLAQMAIQNGQPIPDQILNEQKAEIDNNEYNSGLRQVFLGVGLAIFLGIVAGKIGVGIGALIFFIGLGKVIIARKSDPMRNDPLYKDNFNSNSNNNNQSNNQSYE